MNIETTQGTMTAKASTDSKRVDLYINGNLYPITGAFVDVSQKALNERHINSVLIPGMIFAITDLPNGILLSNEFDRVTLTTNGVKELVRVLQSVAHLEDTAGVAWLPIETLEGTECYVMPWHIGKDVRLEVKSGEIPVYLPVREGDLDNLLKVLAAQKGIVVVGKSKIELIAYSLNPAEYMLTCISGKSLASALLTDKGLARLTEIVRIVASRESKEQS